MHRSVGALPFPLAEIAPFRSVRCSFRSPRQFVPCPDSVPHRLPLERALKSAELGNRRGVDAQRAGSGRGGERERSTA
eukprot:4307675-Pleurochrysis_carterae.AAC.1